MKNKKIFKTLSALCAALVLMMGLSVTAFAQGTDQNFRRRMPPTTAMWSWRKPRTVRP